MSDIQFENEEEYARRDIPQESKGFVTLLQKWGITKNDQQSEYLLIGVILVCFILIIYINFG